jgi:hypothetical protein
VADGRRSSLVAETTADGGDSVTLGEETVFASSLFGSEKVELFADMMPKSGLLIYVDVASLNINYYNRLV